MIEPLGKILERDRPLFTASVASLVMSAVFAILARPGEHHNLTSDPRAWLCGADCYPAAHPWLLILAAACAVAGLIGLRVAFGRARK